MRDTGLRSSMATEGSGAFGGGSERNTIRDHFDPLWRRRLASASSVKVRNDSSFRHLTWKPAKYMSGKHPTMQGQNEITGPGSLMLHSPQQPRPHISRHMNWSVGRR